MHRRNDPQEKCGVHNQADDKHVQDRSEAEFFTGKGHDDANHQTDGDAGRSYGNSEHVCRSLVKHVPWREAKAGFHGHDYADTIKNEAEHQFCQTPAEAFQGMTPLSDYALKNSTYGGVSTMSRGIFLWTVSELPAVRHLYKACGFTPVETKSHFIRGRDIVEELQEINLSAGPVEAG